MSAHITLVSCPACESCYVCGGTGELVCHACDLPHAMACAACDVCGLCKGARTVSATARAAWLRDAGPSEAP